MVRRSFPDSRRQYVLSSSPAPGLVRKLPGVRPALVCAWLITLAMLPASVFAQPVSVLMGCGGTTQCPRTIFGSGKLAIAFLMDDHLRCGAYYIRRMQCARTWGDDPSRYASTADSHLGRAAILGVALGADWEVIRARIAVHLSGMDERAKDCATSAILLSGVTCKNLSDAPEESVRHHLWKEWTRAR